MKRTQRLLLAAALLAAPAAAQHEGAPDHSAHGDPMPIEVEPASPPQPSPPAPRGDHEVHRAHPSAAPAGDAHGAHGEHHAQGMGDDAASGAAGAGGAAHAHHAMVLDADGMVMNHNPDRLPRDCAAVSGEVDLRVRAGREFAAGPGFLYGYDDPVWNVAPCSKVNVTFENRDAVRHQWMVHGLPRYLYPQGMFTLEVNGPGTRTASFIVPSAPATFLVHCDVSHHMEKGMKGQLVVGGGDGDLPSIPGVSEPLYPDRYPGRLGLRAAVGGGIALLLGLSLSLALRRV